VEPAPKEHVCKPSCHNPCLLDDEPRYKNPVGQSAVERPTEQDAWKVTALTWASKVKELEAELSTVRTDRQWLSANLCDKHLGVNLCSSGPCSMCYMGELKADLSKAVKQVEELNGELSTVRAAAKAVLEWAPVCSPGSSGHERLERLRKAIE